MDPDESSLFATRASLLERLRDHEDQQGWQEFFDRYWKLVFSFARRSGLSETDAQDVVQDTMATVARQMPGFRYDPAKGSFKSWLLTVVKRRLIDRHRKERRWTENTAPMPEPPTGTSTAPEPADPAGAELESLWSAEWESHLIGRALGAVRARVSPRQYLMYEQHVVRGEPLATVAANLQASRMSVYLAKHRVGKLMRAELERARAENA
jgi:RNA polymerase sigma-70 factor (ECF subfamily)